MSYQINTRDGIAGSDLRVALDAAIEEQSERGSDGSVIQPGHVADHLGAATAAIEQWFLPVLGKPDLDSYQVEIAGQANPGHTWAEGEADEYLTVTVRVHHARPDEDGNVATVQDNRDASPLESTPLVPVPPQQDAKGVTVDEHDAGNAEANAVGVDVANQPAEPDPAFSGEHAGEPEVVEPEPEVTA